jgi:Zn-dependent protease/tetratricopeptide (TPR) repeat protein
MLRFRLGSIPVEVHPSHLLLSALLAWSVLPGQGSPAFERWPFAGLAGPDAPGFGRAATAHVLTWVFVVFVSVLVHELGHALTSRAFGYRPSIALVWMGGHTQTHAEGPIPWHKDVALTFMGPLFGLGLAAASWFAGTRWAVPGSAADVILSLFTYANLVWAVFNLLPVLPLDGGRISSTLAQRVFGPRGFAVAQVLALLVCAAVVLLAFRMRAPILGVFFVLFGFQAVQALAAYARGVRGPEAEAVPGDHPLAQALREAQAALKEGRLDEARRLGLLLLESEPAAGPALRSRAHHLLGWVCLKEGRGRPALDHFAQVSGQLVEPHALAAAFSLVGDDARAVALWEHAWRESKDSTVLHEWAGSLIRAERTAEALRLPGVDPAAAFACAERVLFIRGAYSEAAQVSEAALAHAPRADIAYDAACAYARAHNVRDALRLLERASELGYRDADYAASDEDLAPLHGQPGFEQWLARLRQSEVG